MRRLSTAQPYGQAGNYFMIASLLVNYFVTNMKSLADFKVESASV